MGSLNPLRKSEVREFKGHLNLEEEFNSKLSEIDDAISTLKMQEKKVDYLIEEKINKILDDKLKTYGIVKPIEVYKKENAQFINKLKEDIRLKYNDFFNNNLTVLEKAKERLTLLREF